MRASIRPLIFGLAVWLATSGASADKLRELVREGNRAYAAEDYDTALEKYRSAQVESPESPYLYFDIANSLAKQGRHEEAAENFLKVHSREQPSLSSWAFYNLGVSQYRQAEEAIGVQDYQKALELLEKCMDSNRQAMKIDPHDEDPKFNFEQAKRKWKEVRDALKKQQEEQQKQQQQNQQNDQQQQDDQQQKGQQKDGQNDQQEQNKDEQQNQESQNKDEQKDNKGQQEQNDKEGEQEQIPEGQQNQQDDQSKTGSSQPQGQPQPMEMTPEDARRLLNGLSDQNKQALQQFLIQQVPRGYRMERDW